MKWLYLCHFSIDFTGWGVRMWKTNLYIFGQPFFPYRWWEFRDFCPWSYSIETLIEHYISFRAKIDTKNLVNWHEEPCNLKVMKSKTNIIKIYLMVILPLANFSRIIRMEYSRKLADFLMSKPAGILFAGQTYYRHVAHSFQSGLLRISFCCFLVTIW